MSSFPSLQFTDPSQIIRLPNSLRFKVYLLEAPLSLLSKAVKAITRGYNIIEINGFHTAVGFQSTDKSQPYEFAFDYGMSSGLSLSAILPNLSPEGTPVWNNFSSVGLFTGINRKYWVYSTYIATVSSEQLITIQEWILEQWIPSNPYYSLFSIIGDGVDIPAKASRAESFCFTLFQFMVAQGICIDYITAPNVTDVSIVTSPSSPATRVPYTGNSEDILLFYSNFAQYLEDVAELGFKIFTTVNKIFTEPDMLFENLKALQNEFFYAVQLFIIFSIDFPYIYYYGYYGNGPDMGYYKIVNPMFYVNYVQSSLKRSYPSLDVYGLPNNSDSHVSPDNQCQIVSSSSSGVLIWVILIVVVVIFLVLAIYTIYPTRRKNELQGLYL